MKDITEMTAVEMAVGLMEGDAATLKAGYTKANAVLAVADFKGLTAEQAETLGEAIDFIVEKEVLYL